MDETKANIDLLYGASKEFDKYLRASKRNSRQKARQFETKGRMKKLKLTDEVKTGLSAFLKVTYPNETPETLAFVLSEFLWDAKENELEFYDIESMTVQETAFCEVYIKTGNASEAYAASHKDCTSKPDSVRSLASRFIHRPNVAAYIQAYLNRVKESAIECGIWSRAQSLIERRDKLNALNADIETRKQTLKTAIELIQNDESLSNADKAQRIIQAIQRPVYGRDTIEAHKALCDSLDALTWTNDSKKVSWYEISGEAHNSWENMEKSRQRAEALEKEQAKKFPALANFFNQ